jgi:amidase
MSKSDDLVLASAVEQVRAVRDGDVSCVELLEGAVGQYEKHNPTLNAVVVERIDDARERARRLDGMPPERRGPLHGVPMTIKDVIDWAGTPSTWGDPAIADYHPNRNAVLLDRLLDAGAVVWGKTNVPFRLQDWQSYNQIHGRSNNPWDLERTPGGSSGGSTAAVASGMAALEIGSDIGGSIRFPSHYCGVFGHKPTFGAVPSRGHNYPGQEGRVDINVCGPMARSAADLALALHVIADQRLVPDPRRRADQFTVGVMLHNPIGEQDDELTSVLEGAITTLRAAGVTVAQPPDTIDHVTAHDLYMLLVRAATAATDAGTDDAKHAARYDRGDRDYKARAGKGFSLNHIEWIELHNQRQRLRDQWADYFRNVDVLLCPPSASAAPHHDTGTTFGEDQTIEVNGKRVSIVDQWLWAGIANGPYLASTVAPVGFTTRGLPVGLQIIGPEGGDFTTIAFASVVEQTLGGFVPPPMIR